MADPNDPTDPNAPAPTEPGVLADKTTETPAHFPGETIPEAEGAAIVPDPAEDGPPRPPTPIRAYAPSSQELARSSRKAARRQRDRRAERRAIQVLVGLFVGVGGLGLVAVNLLLDDPPPAPVASAEATDKTTPTEPPPPPGPPAPSGVISSPHVDTVDLPALRKLRNEGLTIVAEGLPDVSSNSRGSAVGPLAARETCRFAYGVWEFSPNQRFRFIPTCPSMDGQVLFGAYRISGGVIRMSPLQTSGVELVSEFQVEKPSRLITRVTVDRGRYTFSVRQRVTVIRPGLAGDAFFNTYADRNTLAVPGGAKRRPPPAEPRAPAPKKDPLLDMLRGAKAK